jgi:hypothetical protein
MAAVARGKVALKWDLLPSEVSGLWEQRSKPP